MSGKKTNYQDTLLNKARQLRLPCTIYLTNGFFYPNSMIIGFDNYVVVIACKLKDQDEQKQYMIYKHAISTISPVRSIEFNPNAGDKVNGSDDEATG